MFNFPRLYTFLNSKSHFRRLAGFRDLNLVERVLNLQFKEEVLIIILFKPCLNHMIHDNSRGGGRRGTLGSGALWA